MKNLPEGFDREGVRGAVDWLSTLPQTALVVNPENGKLQNIESAAGYTRRLLRALLNRESPAMQVLMQMQQNAVKQCAGSGCNYPEGECLGHCVLARLTKNQQ